MTGAHSFVMSRVFREHTRLDAHMSDNCFGSGLK